MPFLVVHITQQAVIMVSLKMQWPKTVLAPLLKIRVPLNLKGVPVVLTEGTWEEEIKESFCVTFFLWNPGIDVDAHKHKRTPTPMNVRTHNLPLWAPLEHRVWLAVDGHVAYHWKHSTIKSSNKSEKYEHLCQVGTWTQMGKFHRKEPNQLILSQFTLCNHCCITHNYNCPRPYSSSLGYFWCLVDLSRGNKKGICACPSY